MNARTIFIAVPWESWKPTAEGLRQLSGMWPRPNHAVTDDGVVVPGACGRSTRDTAQRARARAIGGAVIAGEPDGAVQERAEERSHDGARDRPGDGTGTALRIRRIGDGRAFRTVTHDELPVLPLASTTMPLASTTASGFNGARCAQPVVASAAAITAAIGFFTICSPGIPRGDGRRIVAAAKPAR
jgi:hypothetical protein